MYSHPAVACVVSGSLNVVTHLSCCDLSLAFFDLVLYSTKKLHCLIPEGQKVLLLQVFNLGVEIVAERM